jgi:hypothetical protein
MHLEEESIYPQSPHPQPISHHKSPTSTPPPTSSSQLHLHLRAPRRSLLWRPGTAWRPVAPELGHLDGPGEDSAKIHRALCFPLGILHPANHVWRCSETEKEMLTTLVVGSMEAPISALPAASTRGPADGRWVWIQQYRFCRLLPVSLSKFSHGMKLAHVELLGTDNLHRLLKHSHAACIRIREYQAYRPSSMRC